MEKKRGRPDLGLHERFIMMMTAEMVETIREAAQAEGITMSEWVRQAIKEKAESKPWLNIETRDQTIELKETLRRYLNRGARG